MRGVSCLTNHPEYFIYIKKLVDKTGAVAYNSCKMFLIQGRAKDLSVGTLSHAWNTVHWLCVCTHQRG